MTELYSGEIAELIREHGYKRTAEILAERRQAASRPPAEPTQGDASDLSEAAFREAVQANKRQKEQ